MIFLLVGWTDGHRDGGCHACTRARVRGVCMGEGEIRMVDLPWFGRVPHERGGIWALQEIALAQPIGYPRPHSGIRRDASPPARLGAPQAKWRSVRRSASLVQHSSELGNCNLAVTPSSLKGLC
jgi:hypothetical protein